MLSRCTMSPIGAEGIEPSPTGCKPIVLPLDHAPEIAPVRFELTSLALSRLAFKGLCPLSEANILFQIRLRGYECGMRELNSRFRLGGPVSCHLTNSASRHGRG